MLLVSTKLFAYQTKNAVNVISFMLQFKPYSIGRTRWATPNRKRKMSGDLSMLFEARKPMRRQSATARTQ